LINTSADVVVRGSLDDCAPPQYFVAVDGTSPAPGPEKVPGFKQISIARSDFTVSNLKCLARVFRNEPSAKVGLTVFVFDTRWAAADFFGGDVMTMAREIAQSYRYLRAEIEIDPATASSITLKPLGYKNGSEFESRIGLDGDGSECRFQVGSRCLLAFDPIEGVKESDGSASVTLDASLGRNGDVTGVHVVAAQGLPAARRRLTSAAMRNARTWWFEPMGRRDNLRISYRLGPETSRTSDPADLVLQLSNGLAAAARTLK
jgi:hypothetical protein